MRRFTLSSSGFKPPLKAVRIFLPMHLNSNLNWNQEREFALRYVEEGNSLIWEFELGLFHLPLPLNDEGQLMALQLGVRHFSEKFYPEFETNTAGVILYRGNLQPPFDLEYLLQLLPELPDSVFPLLAFDGCSEEEIFHFLSLPGSEHFHLILDGEFPYESASQGLLLPAAVSKNLPVRFRAIPERLLTQQWEGLDRLYVDAQSLSPQGKRKLNGFVAAGGEVIFINDK